MTVSCTADAAARAEAEVASGPDVWFVLVRPANAAGAQWWAYPLYAVQLPFDLDRFRLWDDGYGFDVLFKYRGRWCQVWGAWRQLKRMNLDAADNRPCSVKAFGRRILKGMGVRKWQPRKGR